MIPRPIDLGLEDQSEDNITFLERDAPKVSFSKCIDKVITEKQAKEAGKCLNDNRVISLIFLLLPYKRGYDLAREIEMKKLTVPAGMSYGEALLLSLMSYAQNNSWELKVMCALHLLKQYKAIMILNPRLGPGSSIKTRQEFDGKERFFIDPVRIELLNVCQDLKKDDARQAMVKVTGDTKCNWNRLETGFLQEMQTKGQEWMLKMIMQHLDRDSDDLIQRRGRKDAVNLKRGKLLIIALENYNTKGYCRREGTQPDIDALVRTFRQFGCSKKHIKVERDLTGEELIPAMKRFNNFLNESKESDIDFCVVAIIGHGRINGQTKREEIVGIDGKVVPKDALKDIIFEAKSCPVMHGKPKIFLIQACRGIVDNKIFKKEPTTLGDSGIESSGIGSDGEEVVAQNSWHLTFQSTVPGYTSYRHKEMGSFFIQIFCHTMEQIGHLSSFSEVLLKTKQMVNRIFPQQVPIVENCITEELHFCKSS